MEKVFYLLHIVVSTPFIILIKNLSYAYHPKQHYI